MSYRYMRIIVFYDLPTITAKERYYHHRFRKFLINEGFIMMQESVYSKIALNPTASELVKERIKKGLPPNGLVQIMIVTEKQYAGIEFMLGDDTKNTNTLNSTSRLVVF